jgi:nucleoside-diphosphate-sugar epimerase
MTPPGSRILLTGATGFIGAHVLRRLLADERVQVAAFLRTTSDAWRIRDLAHRVQRIDGDLRQIAAAESAVAAFAPDTVLHLAWTGVTNTFRNDPQQIDNVEATVNLVRLSHRIGVRHWIGLGSQAEYGPHEGPLREDTPTHPTTLYGITKLSACMLAQHLCATANIRFAWLRLFSAYGPMDDPSWMIPYLTLRLLRHERPALTAGRQRWDYVHVEDAAEAVCRVAATGQATGIFNLGSGRTATIREIVERIRDLVDPVAELGFGEVPYRPDQVMHLEADITKLTTATAWTPQTSLDEGLRRTVDWYRQWHAGRTREPRGD